MRKYVSIVIAAVLCLSGCGKEVRAPEEPADSLSIVDSNTTPIPATSEESGVAESGTAESSEQSEELPSYNQNDYVALISDADEHPVQYAVAGSEGYHNNKGWFHGEPYVDFMSEQIYDFVSSGIAKLYHDCYVTDEWYCDYGTDVLGYDEAGGLIVTAHSANAEIAVIFYGDSIYEWVGTIGLTSGSAGKFSGVNYLQYTVVNPYEG